MASKYRMQIVHNGQVVEWMPGHKIETDIAQDLCERLAAKWITARSAVQPSDAPAAATFMERVYAVFSPSPAGVTAPVEGLVAGSKEKVMLDLRDCVADMFYDLKRKV